MDKQDWMQQVDHVNHQLHDKHLLDLLVLLQCHTCNSKLHMCCSASSAVDIEPLL
jgi:hypothetical protein